MHGNRDTAVYVWDSNPFNPYGTELARVIGDISSVLVTHFTRQGRAYRAQNVTTKSIIPAPAAVSRSRNHKIKYLYSIVFFLASCATARPVVIFPWITNRSEVVLARIVQLLFIKTIVVIHNPTEERDEIHELKGLAELRRSATRLVVHSSLLQSQFYLSTVVASHPSYRAWKDGLSSLSCGAQACSNSSSKKRRTAVFIGSIREDKGFYELPRLADYLDTMEVDLQVCLGIYKEQDLFSLRAKKNVSIVGNGTSYLSDEVLYAQLQHADVMIAPYKNVTVSGTVLLAMTLGVPVVAYDCPEFARFMAPENLAPSNNLQMLAEIARQVPLRDAPTSYWAERQDDRATKEWSRILNAIEI